MSENNSKNDNRLIAASREKLTTLRSDGFNYPPTIKPSTCAKDIIDEYDSLNKEDLEGIKGEFTIAGRMMAKRVMGKSSFSLIKDGSGSIQIFISKKDLGDESYSNFKTMDVGDINSIKGKLLTTNTHELTSHLYTSDAPHDS